MMPRPDIDAIQARQEAATKNKNCLIALDCEDYPELDHVACPTCTMYAHAPTDIRELLEWVEELEAGIKQLGDGAGWDPVQQLLGEDPPPLTEEQLEMADRLGEEIGRRNAEARIPTGGKTLRTIRPEDLDEDPHA